MTKAQIIERLSEQVPTLTKRQAEIVVNTVFDSIRDEEHAVVACQLGQPPEVGGRLDPHPRCALDERLDDQCGAGFRVGGERGLRLVERCRERGVGSDPALPAEHVRRRQADGG